MKSFTFRAMALAWALSLPALCSAGMYNISDLGTLGGTLSIGYGINASGQVTGLAYTTENAAHHPFLYDGLIHDLGTLGGTNSGGLSINTSGQVTGYATTTDSALHAFLYDGVNPMVDLNMLIDPASGWELSTGQGINDLGQITGGGSIGGQEHAFVLTPLSVSSVPEPSSLVLAALGFAGLLALARRKYTNPMR